ncbi:DNA-directed DNA polymerase [archaeon]|nr:DNA-directed DNA polymerase [archaeon]
MKGVLLNVQSENSLIKLFIKNTETGKIEILEDDTFQPYFYLQTDVPEEAEKLGPGLKKIEKGKMLKIITEGPGDVPILREKAAKLGEIREYDIPYTQRYLIDKGIKPMKRYEWQSQNGKLISYKESPGEWKITRQAFDIETYSADGVFRMGEDPVIMASFWNDLQGKVLTWKPCDKGFVQILKDEQELIEAINKELETVDVVYTYNGDNFDLPYIKKRSEKLGLTHQINVKNAGPRLKSILKKSIHLDAYTGVNFMRVIGSLRLPRYTLEDVYKEFTGKEKIDIEIPDLWENWEKGQLDTVTEYSLQDAEAAYVIGERLLQLYIELAKLLNQTVYDVSRMSASQMVELLLVKKAFERNEISPNRPDENEFRTRIREPIKGAFVRQPESGLHENLVVLDFRSLYPSIIISHNVSPDTLDSNAKEAFTSPNGYKFRKDKRGIIPEMLEEVLNKRFEIKTKLKQTKGEEQKRLNAEQQALKILANATYGYTLYARARWYSRECGESITAWGRQYIQDIITKAEEAGFKVLYGDTDSVFLKREGKTKEEVLTFLNDYNKKLPEAMQLELEGFYTRGIFVTKREGGAAKKRYALIREDGQVEIKGLEFVRRDWSALAKKTQRKVIQAVLENKIEKAKEIVCSTIEDIRAEKVPVEEFVIYTQLKRRIKQYTAIGPHVKAAIRLKESGSKVRVGTTIGYVVTRGAGNIGDKSHPIQLIGSRKPDPEYYISHQVLPAVMKILAELDINEDDLSIGGKQSSLDAWT